MNKSENISQQEILAREFESWQKQYYDDVYSLFEKRDEHRLVIAFNLWEDRFIRFLEDRLPGMVETYKTQTSQFIPLSYHGGSLQDFKTSKSEKIEAFLAQYIVDARKGNLDSYYMAPKKYKRASQISREKKSNPKRLRKSIVITIPQTIGQFVLDILGRDKASVTTARLLGWMIIIGIILLATGVLTPELLINIWHFFFPEPK